MEEEHVTVKTAEHSVSHPTPVIVDLGKKSKKAIKKLKKGEGPLPLEVEEAIHQVGLRLAGSGKHIVPVVVIYGRKRKRTGLPSLPFSPLNLLR